MSSALCMSVLLPAASSSKLAAKGCRVNQVEKVCSQILGLDKEDFSLFALVPLKDEHLRADSIQNNPEIAIRLLRSNMTLKTVQEMKLNTDQHKQLLEKTNEALLTYVGEVKRMRKFLLETNIGGNLDDEANKEILMKKALKSKDLEEDNKKLRKLLKTQLENAENLRLETQNTIETLREEFDLLVKELMNYKKREGANKGSPAQEDSNSKNKKDQATKETKSSGASGVAIPKLKLGGK